MSRIQSLASDTIIYGGFTIVGRFLTFLLTPIYSNYLTKTEVGDITNIFSIIAFLNIIYSFGMESAFFRFYSKKEPENVSLVFSMSYWTILIIALFVSSVICIFAESLAPMVSNMPNAVDLVRLGAFIPLFDCLLIIPMAFLRMTRKARRFATTRFSMIFVAVTLNIVFIIPFRMNAPGVFYAQIISSIFGFILLFRELRSYLNIRFNLGILRQMLRFGLPTLPASLAGMVLQVVNIPILRAMTGTENVAMYAVNHRLGIPMMLFVSVFEYAWKPFYLGHFEDKDAKKLFARVFTYFTLVSAILFLSVGFFIEYIVRLPFIGGKFINPEYWGGMGIIPLVLGGYYFNGVFNNFAAGFHITKKTDYLPVAIGVAAILNVVLNILLIPSMDIYGSVLATFISYLVSALILLGFSGRVYKIEYEWGRVLLLIVFTSIMYYTGVCFAGSFGVGGGFVVKLFVIILFVLILFLTKFFTKAEVKSILNLFRFKK